MESRKKPIRVSFNSPAILVFTGICLITQILNVLTHGASNTAVFSVYRSSLLDPLTYVRCICHVFGHTGWSHLLANLMYILILGPMIEEKYSTSNTVIVMAATAVVTGIINMVFFPSVMLTDTEAPTLPPPPAQAQALRTLQVDSHRVQNVKLNLPDDRKYWYTVYLDGVLKHRIELP